VESTKPLYERLNHDVAEKMDVLGEYRKRKLAQVLEDVVDGTRDFGASIKAA